MVRADVYNTCKHCTVCIDCGRKNPSIELYRLQCDDCKDTRNRLYLINHKQLCIECAVCENGTITGMIDISNYEDYVCSKYNLCGGQEQCSNCKEFTAI